MPWKHEVGFEIGNYTARKERQGQGRSYEPEREALLQATRYQEGFKARAGDQATVLLVQVWGDMDVNCYQLSDCQWLKFSHMLSSCSTK